MKNAKGITIISLIVTIIVMLILAGIALIFSVTEEGVIQRGIEAKNRQRTEEIKDEVELFASGIKLEKGIMDFSKVEEKLEEYEEVSKIVNLSEVNNTVEFRLYNTRYYVNEIGEVIEGYSTILPQGEWTLYMNKGLSSSQIANYLNVKIEGNEITFNSEEYIYPGWQDRDNCVLITEGVKAAKLDDGGSAQIHPYFDSKLRYPLEVGDKIEYGVEYISGKIINENGTNGNGKVHIHYAGNTEPKMGVHDNSWKNTFNKSLNHTTGERISKDTVVIPNYFLKGIYFSRFKTVKFEDYKIKLTFRVNGDDIV